MTRLECPGECYFGNFNAHYVICIIGFLVMENSAVLIHAFVIETISYLIINAQYLHKSIAFDSSLGTL